MPLTRDHDRPAVQQVALVLLIGVLTASLWYGWFAWDTEYQYDAATGRMTGPYVAVGSTVGTALMLGLAGAVDVGLRRRTRRTADHGGAAT